MIAILYFRSDGTLYKTVPNVIDTIYNVSNLESAVNYSATVSAVYKVGFGQRHVSPESKPVYFQTGKKSLINIHQPLDWKFLVHFQ